MPSFQENFMATKFEVEYLHLEGMTECVNGEYCSCHTDYDMNYLCSLCEKQGCKMK